jgi:hypothetical protein
MIDRRTALSTLIPKAAAALLLGSSALFASGQRPVTVPERITGAERVVVAKAARVQANWQQNAYGDMLIVSEILLEVEETLKGSPDRLVWLDLEGGTLGGITLRVSDLPEIRAGERAVFFLDRTDSANFAPHLRGQGILKLDPQNVVTGSSLRLDDIRRMAREGR